MIAVLEQVAARAEERKAAQQAEWAACVKSIGDGGKADPEDVEALLADLGRTPAELGEAVNLYRRRVGLAKALAQRERHEQKRDAADRGAADANAALAADLDRLAAEGRKVREAHAERVRKLQAQRAEAEAGLREAEAARQELVATVPAGPAADALAAARAAVAAAEKEAAAADRSAGTYRESAEKYRCRGGVQEAAMAENCLRHAADRTMAAADWRRRAAALAADVRAAEAACLEP